MQIGREFDEQWVLAASLHILGWIAYCQGEWEETRQLEEEGVAIFRTLRFPTFGLEALCLLASARAMLENLAGAQALLEEALTLSEESGEAPEIARVSCGLGYQALRKADLEGARRYFEDSVRTIQQARHLATRFHHILTSSLEGLAAVACAQAQPLRTAWLLGTADHLRHAGNALNPLGREVPFWENTREVTLSTLGVSTFTRALTEGGHMTPLQALTVPEPETKTRQVPIAEPAALDGSAAPASLSADDAHLPPGDRLTKREIDVLHLLAQGLSNAEIAESLVLSVVTINSYLRSIYSKLGVSSRTRATRYALDHHLLS